MNLIVEFLSIGALAVQASIIFCLSIYIASRRNIGDEVWNKIEEVFSHYWKQASFTLALIATAGSLYMSNIEHMIVFKQGFFQIVERPLTGGTRVWTPCRLCWFQRIFMYPLTLLLGISILLKEKVSTYVIPLSMIGGGIAGYHYIIQRIEQFQSAGCSITSISCETEYTFYMGIVTIPFMAFTAFLGILLVNWRYGESKI